MNQLQTLHAALIARAHEAHLSRAFLHTVTRIGLDARHVQPLTNIVGPPSATTVRWIDNGRFELAPHDTINALVIPVLESDGETVGDFLALDLHQPERWATAFRTAPVLGAWNVVNPASYFGNTPLPLFRYPLDWIKGGCRGGVLLHPYGAAEMLSRAVGDLLAEDHAHARWVADIVCRPLVDPRRIVFRLEKRAAA
jgi:hypothetical protein